MPNVTIIIPVKNEEKSIITTLKKIQSNVKISHEILIVYDSPSDPTKAKAEEFIKDKKIKNVSLHQTSVGNKKGVINAIKTGISKAHGKALVITMADLSDDISQIDEMYALINHDSDIVAASRYMRGGKKVGGPFLKTALSKVAGVTLHYIFRIPTSDATNAYKMYRKDIFKDIKIESTGGFEYSLEIVIKAHKKGYKITEIPTVWHDRVEGKSNFKLMNWLPKYIKTYMLVFNSKN